MKGNVTELGFGSSPLSPSLCSDLGYSYRRRGHRVHYRRGVRRDGFAQEQGPYYSPLLMVSTSLTEVVYCRTLDQHHGLATEGEHPEQQRRPYRGRTCQ
jgi:hypothetical protein